jgi:hypothetical protein
MSCRTIVIAHSPQLVIVWDEFRPIDTFSRGREIGCNLGEIEGCVCRAIFLPYQFQDPIAPRVVGSPRWVCGPGRGEISDLQWGRMLIYMRIYCRQPGWFTYIGILQTAMLIYTHIQYNANTYSMLIGKIYNKCHHFVQRWHNEYQWTYLIK